MLLIDALHIHLGGGKTLLTALVHAFKDDSDPVFWLLDERTTREFNFKSPNHVVVYKKANLLNRWRFYRANRSKFTKVFCLGNIPPPVSLKATVYTYFHTTYFITKLPFLSVKRRFINFLKRKVLFAFKKQTDHWIVQTETIQQQFSTTANIPHKGIQIIPFFNDFFRDTDIEKEKDLYIYVGFDTPHKNHIRLMHAFCDFFDQTRQGRLVITVPKDSHLIPMLEQKVQSGYPIENVGVLNRQQLHQLYNRATYHIYPSLTESFGLGIIESIQCGCKIIGADLPYMHEICEPSIVFDPFDIHSIHQALLNSAERETISSECLISNKTKILISILKTET